MREFLVIQILRFGDVVQTKRLVMTLAQRGHVHLLVAMPLVPLAQMLYPYATIHGLHLHGGSLDHVSITENRKTFAALRTLNFENVYNCNSAGLSEAVCRLFPREIVIGHRPWSTSGGGAIRSPWVRLHTKLMGQRNSACCNIVDYWAHFAEQAIAPEEVNPPAKGGGRGLGIVLAGSQSRRSLPIPMLAEIIKIFVGVLQSPSVFLFGTKAESVLASKLLHALPSNMKACVQDLSGRTDWYALHEALQGLDALVTPDTGTMHLACHLGVPVHAFFLSSAFCHETGPYGEGHWVWQSAPECAPCLESAPCNHEMICLQALEHPLFLRSIAKTALANGKRLEMPPHVQLWRGTHDYLGGCFSLVGGDDAHSRERADKRALLSHYLCASGGDNLLEKQPSGTICELLGEFEWMLPPGRYC